jgi:hypothetical protein
MTAPSRSVAPRSQSATTLSLRHTKLSTRTSPSSAGCPARPPLCAPGRTRTHDPLLRSKGRGSGVLTKGFPGRQRAEDRKLSAVGLTRRRSHHAGVRQTYSLLWVNVQPTGSQFESTWLARLTPILGGTVVARRSSGNADNHAPRRGDDDVRWVRVPARRAMPPDPLLGSTWGCGSARWSDSNPNPTRPDRRRVPRCRSVIA